ncbi:MAG: diaminopropionate ammonia-lyase, partial [Spartobacteria bacterium]|nr:diaminopropionate ammonia-lyase [Spartobacteria bacterium]
MNEERSAAAEPIQWIINEHAASIKKSAATNRILPPGVTEKARHFHQQIVGYRMSPLKNLPNLAAMLGVKAIWVKDESLRMSLNSFKVLGGSFAIYRFLQERLGCVDREMNPQELMDEVSKQDLAGMTFASATDGNHGRGVAWAASQLGFNCVIYVHKLTSKARIQAIEQYGAKVVIIDGTYDDAVRQINKDAQQNGWQVISDTSWEGYEDIPCWVMQGYTTMLSETQE